MRRRLRGRRAAFPFSVMRELKTEIERRGADCLVSLGGGSRIDMCKLAAYSILTGSDLTTTHQLIEGAKPGAHTGRELVHIAIPTSLSAAEYTNVAGVTDDNTRVRVPIHACSPEPSSTTRLSRWTPRTRCGCPPVSGRWITPWK